HRRDHLGPQLRRILPWFPCHVTDPFPITSSYLGTCPETSGHLIDHVTQPVMLIRLRHNDSTGDTRRVAHFVPVLELVDGVPQTLTAWCGWKISPAEAELLDRFTGIPCEQCMAQAPTPQGTQLHELTQGDQMPHVLDQEEENE
nr:hypothetical protein [Actinomycetota bacterium]